MRDENYHFLERTVGTVYYLKICANYIKIFCSHRLDLRSKIVLYEKESFFFRIWRLWFQNGDYGVLGNSQKMSEAKNFVNL